MMALSALQCRMEPFFFVPVCGETGIVEGKSFPIFTQKQVKTLLLLMADPQEINIWLSHFL